MAKRLLIDATHTEEVRVAVVNGSVLEEFDSETSHKRQIKSNIYLAKVIRVEPSLQAAFVEYSGGKHGFLPFAEIHPDYYRIPVADREKFLKELEEEIDFNDDEENDIEHDDHISNLNFKAHSDADHPDESADEISALQIDQEESNTDALQKKRSTSRKSRSRVRKKKDDQSSLDTEKMVIDVVPETPAVESESDTGEDQTSTEEKPKRRVRKYTRKKTSTDVTTASLAIASFDDEKEHILEASDDFLKQYEPEDQTDSDIDQDMDEDIAESVDDQGDLDIEDENPSREKKQRLEKKKRITKRQLLQQYKIQEVIKRRQILLIQVLKEERGNKGASLTTYLSLPGRYCVLMPNAGHRMGGISRKISDGEDRRRLRELMQEFEVPEGMSLIVRTAGQERNKSEIRRDYEYLLRLWDDIRETTMQSIAPALIYAEGDLVKRAIRDIYDRDIEEILIEGEDAYKKAKTFMRSLIPSHAKKVKLYKNHLQPIFHRFNVESQIERMHEPMQMLPSGGSIVINHTEALVAIDVNSGKSTRERHIDETAFKTNMEAAVEIARQVRLRDIGGLVVVDFIDMQDSSHITQVERRMRDLLKSDRARVQIGKISQFGLLEMSRQRLRPSLLENHSLPCAHCRGTGLVRSNESLALQILRDIERVVISGTVEELRVIAPTGVDLFLLNQKRAAIVQLEKLFNVHIQIDRDDTLIAPKFHMLILGERARTLQLAESHWDARNQRRPHNLDKEPLFENASDDDDEDDTVLDHETEENIDTPSQSSDPNQRKEEENQEEKTDNMKKRSRPNSRKRRQNKRRREQEEQAQKEDFATDQDSIEDNDQTEIILDHIGNDNQPFDGEETMIHQHNVNDQDGSLKQQSRRRRHPYQRRSFKTNMPVQSNDNLDSSSYSLENPMNSHENETDSSSRPHEHRDNGNTSYYLNRRRAPRPPRQEDGRTVDTVLNNQKKPQNDKEPVPFEKPVSSKPLKNPKVVNESDHAPRSTETDTQESIKKPRARRGWLRRLLDS